MTLVSLKNLRSRQAIVLLIGVLFGLLGVACEVNAATQSTLDSMAQIWREEFPLPATQVPNRAERNVGMAPPTFGSAKTAPRAGVQRRLNRPHPAVARIVVPEKGATSYGSGTLIDVREGFGLVITNWHVVRDATGAIEVLFPDGFTSPARALKVDSDWDLAALVIWRPQIEPVSIAARAPQPGDQLTICGYGQGMYRSATGRCTQYYAPRRDFPRHMVELDVEARQGDSGGPIFNHDGEMAGVLFGAGQGTTLGSFGGRVGAFLATLAPDIGQAEESLAENAIPENRMASQSGNQVCCRESGRCEGSLAADRAAAPSATLKPHQATAADEELAGGWPAEFDTPVDPFQQASLAPQQFTGAWRPAGRDNLFEQMKNVLAAIGLVAVVVQMLRVAR